jgi:hypothetical protein
VNSNVRRTVVPEVFRLRSDVERYLWLTLVDEGESEALEPIREAESIAARWRPLAVEPIVETLADGGKVLSDFPPCWVIPTFSAKAVLKLRDILAKHGELLPLRNQPYYFYNVTTLVDALDESASAIQRFSSGNIMSIGRCVLRASAIDGAGIFRLPQFRRVDVFVDARFRERVVEAGLTGFLFDSVIINEAA